MKYLVLALGLLSLATRAEAAVQVSEQILQKGQYYKAQCKPDGKDPDYDDCICDSDIRYPELSGMDDAKTQDKLNDWFKTQGGKSVCAGQKVNPPASPSGLSHMGISVHYEVTLATPRILAFKFTDWAYTGGAHGNGSIVGVIVDLNSGKLLGPDDIFPGTSLPGVNQAIYAALSAKSEEEIFHDQVEARKGAFLKDGTCQGCTLIVTPDGVHVQFQTYEVAPYGQGNTDVLIPAKYIGNKDVAAAIKQASKPAPKDVK